MDEKNEALGQLPFNSNVEAENRYAKHWQLFKEYQERRNQKVRFLNKNGLQRNILDYVNDSVDRMNEYKLKPSHKEDWQSNTFQPITRDKLIAILSKMASARMKPEVLLKLKSIFINDESNMRKTIFSDLLENANEHNEDEKALIWEMYTALTEGTVFGFESWKKDAREVEYVKEYNPDTGEKVVEKVKIDAWDDVYGELVPIEEFYPETIWVNDLAKIKRAFWVREMTFAGFHDTFGKFANARQVEPASHSLEQEGFDWGISSDVKPQNVEVVMFFDEASDKHGIWANGVELYYGCLPWNHKRLPFWHSIGEPIHAQFLYGKSLPDKLMGMQDINNAVFNAMLDQLYLSLNSPIFIDGESDDLDDGYLEPGRIYKMDQGTRIEQTNLGRIDQAAFSMLDAIKRSMEESSISAQAQGVPTGGRKTKFEVQALQEGALNLAGLFLQMMEMAQRNKYKLRLSNILQYYSMPSRVESGKPKYKFISIEGRKLSNGKTGKRMVQIVDNRSEIPGTEKLAAIAEKEEGREFDPLRSRVEPIIITREYLLNKDYEMEIRIVPNSSVKESAADKKNKDIAFYQATVQNPFVDQEANIRDFARAFDKPDDIIKRPEDVQQPTEEGQEGGMAGIPGMEGMPNVGAPNLEQL